MANWITHERIADDILEKLHGLDRTGFSVGNIAPDCNVENEDWTAFVPPREVTHWMDGERKSESDCERFYRCRIEGREFSSERERSFFMGYYAHLVTDACFQRFIRDEERVSAMLARIKSCPEMAKRMEGLPDDFDAVKRAFSKGERMRDIDAIEYEYFQNNPKSAYRTVLFSLKEFPDYLDYLPKGAVVRKLRVMAVPPEPVREAGFIFFTREEYSNFVEEARGLILEKLKNVY